MQLCARKLLKGQDRFQSLDVTPRPVRASNPIFTRIRLHRGPDHTLSMRPVVNVRVVPVIGSGNLSTENRLGRHTPQLLGQAHFGQCPDDPLRRIKLPGLYAIAIVVRKLMVIVMVALAERY